MRIGIIGTGRHGSRYAGHIVNDVEGLSLAAVSRRSNEGRLQADRWCCTWHPEWRSLVGDPMVDAVIAAVPPALNLDIARACAEAGKPLLLEKPLAADAAQAESIRALTGENGLRLTVGQTLRYNSVIATLRSNLPELGRLYSFSANQRLEPSTLAWHEEPGLAGAGVSFHTAVHVFDALRYITGLQVVRVMAAERQRRNRALEDLLVVLVEMEGGVLGVVDCSKVGPARSGRLEFVGERGQLHGEQIYNRCQRITGTEVSELDPGPPRPTIVPLLRDWQRYLEGRGGNPVEAGEGLAAVRVCSACLEASRTGGWVEVEPVQ